MMTSSALYCVGLHFSHIIIPKLTTARELRLCTSLLVLDILRVPLWTQSLLFSILPPRSWLSRRTCLPAFCWVWHAMQEIEEWGGKRSGCSSLLPPPGLAVSVPLYRRPQLPSAGFSPRLPALARLQKSSLPRCANRPFCCCTNALCWFLVLCTQFLHRTLFSFPLWMSHSFPAWNAISRNHFI